jgi:hypothetical protein
VFFLFADRFSGNPLKYLPGNQEPENVDTDVLTSYGFCSMYWNELALMRSVVAQETLDPETAVQACFRTAISGGKPPAS